jgi:hypothetical protein
VDDGSERSGTPATEMGYILRSFPLHQGTMPSLTYGSHSVMAVTTHNKGGKALKLRSRPMHPAAAVKQDAQ